MTNQPPEIISGERVMGLLRYLIDSNHLCKLKIPNTPYCLITLLSAIQKEGDTEYLLVDGVSGFEQALALSKDGEITLEYSDFGGALCHFNTRVIKVFPKMIWVECPGAIYRIQRRKYYRLKALGGTEIVFHLHPAKEERAKVRDYSLGGVAFFTKEALILKINDQLENLSLRIPEEGAWVLAQIPLAVTRRVDYTLQAGIFIYALDFLQMSDTTKNLLARHIFEKQRLLLRKFGKKLSFSGFF